MKKTVLMTLVGLLMIFQSCRKEETTTDNNSGKSFAIKSIVVANNGLTGELLTSKVKVVPQENAPITNYKIKFISYDGAATSKIYFGNNEVTLNQAYSIPILNEIVFKTKSFTKGNKVLKFVIFNNNEEVEYILSQTIELKTIKMENVQINTKVLRGDAVMFKATVVKTANPTGNKNIKFKTWLSNTQNNATLGTSNNTYNDYTLNNENKLEFNLQTYLVGDVVLNIQIMDEYGNESEIIQYPINISNLLFTETPNYNVIFGKHALYFDYNEFIVNNFRVKGFNSSIKVKSLEGNKINKIQYKLKYKLKYKAENTYQDKTEIVENIYQKTFTPVSEYTVSNEYTSLLSQTVVFPNIIKYSNLTNENSMISEKKIIITAYTENGNTVSSELNNIDHIIQTY